MPKWNFCPFFSGIGGSLFFTVEYKKKEEDLKMEPLFNSTKKLGFGLMRLPLTDPDDAASIDLEQTCRMVDEFLAQGFTYFDTAWMYCGFESENAARKALVERHPRDSFTLTTKLHAGFLNTKEDRDCISMNSSKKPAWTILIIICFMIWAKIISKNIRNLTVLTGSGTKRKKVLSDISASLSTTRPMSWMKC